MNKIALIVVLVVVLLSVITFSFIFAEAQSEPMDLVLLAGGTGATNYPMMGAIGALLTEKIEWVKSATPQVTAASVENLRLLEKGQGDFAIISGGTVASAMTSTITFEGLKPPEHIRTMFWCYPSILHIMVPKDSPIESIDDLKGKTVNFGEPGAGLNFIVETLLGVHGITKDDVRSRWGSFAEGKLMIKEGILDCLPLTFPVPGSIFVDIASVRPIKLISIDIEMLKKYSEKIGGYRTGIIPANTYPGIDYEVTTIDSPHTFICRDDTPEELVYQVTKIVAENLDYLSLTHHAFETFEFDPNIADSMRCPLHPGAERYYREIGKLK